MNCNTALNKAASQLKAGQKISHLHIRSVWLHTAILQLSKKDRKAFCIAKPEPLGAGKWSVAYPSSGSDDYIVLMSVNKSTGIAAKRLVQKPLVGVVQILMVGTANITNPADGKTCEVYELHCPKLKPLSKSDVEEVNYTVDYLWSLARLIKKHGAIKALDKVLEHIALVEYEEKKAPKVVRELFGIMTNMYQSGYWHTDVWQPNLFRDADGKLTLVDVGAIRKLDKVKWEGRPDPYRGDFVTRMGNANVEKQIEELTESGWYPAKAARARARKIRRKTLKALGKT